MGGNSGGGLSAAQTSQLNAMLAATKVPPTTLAAQVGVGAAPTNSPFSNLAQNARTTLLKRQGYNATVKTSPLGDIGFGTSLQRPMAAGVT